MEYGYQEGDVCNRNGCCGEICIYPVENCSCHIAPPCAECTSPRAYCPVCDWQQKDDDAFDNYVCNINPKTGFYRMWTLRPLDNTKIDWHSHAHTHFTMIKRGVYPNGTTKEMVEKEVKGTFGGRFNYFADGKFEYVSYTD